MSHVKKYCEAVARRKPYDHRRSINWAILPVLVDDDVPRLLGIIDEQNKALIEIMNIGEEWDDEDDATAEEAAKMNLLALHALMGAERLAEYGSQSLFGPEGKNGKQ